MKRLSDLPNIGRTLETKLKEVNIETPDQLISVGAEQAFVRLRTIDEGACLNMLCALKGAILGIRWHQLPQERKDELRAFCRIKEC